MSKPVNFCPPETLYQDKYQKINKVRANFADFSKDYYIRYSGERSGIVLCKKDSVLLVKQYRILIQDYSWELPGGKVEEGELPDVAAHRECLEETGFDCYDLQPLVFYHVGLDTSHNPTDIFYTNKFEQKKSFLPDPREAIEIKWFPFDECLKLIFTKKIVDSFTIIGLLSLHAINERK